MKKRGQVWVETVIYTLIAFVMIGAVLTFVRPKIEEFQDKAIIEQTLAAFEDINNIIMSIVQGGVGNKRIPEMGLKKGLIKIDGEADKIIFEIEGKYAYGEDKQDVLVGNVMTYTENKGKLTLVTLTLDYSDKYDITYQEKDELKLINKAATPYKIAISNNGKENTKTKIDFEVI
jgi:type II secretory pathway pseudopilin PulG